MRIFWGIVLLFFVFESAAQQKSGIVIGKTLDVNNNKIEGANILFKQKGQKNQSFISNQDGVFLIQSFTNDSFEIFCTMVGYESLKKTGRIDENNKKIKLVLNTNNKQLNELKVTGNQIRTEQKGDTTVINASAFKVNPDASTEDLVKKMPGITNESGTLKAQGEEVKKVLVDGKEFFGDDAQMAIKNLPAEVVDKVQVYNRLSDQSLFSGFNDGNTDKTMNLVTRGGGVNGLFGKLYAGYGTDSRYQLGGNLNLFDGNRRITILGLSNNINVQNFTAQDITGAGASRGQNPPQGMGRPGMMGRPGGAMGGGNPVLNNFLVGQQGGVNTTSSAGLNYSNKLGKKLDVSASYFFNESRNETEKATNRIYLIDTINKQTYTEKSTSSSNNLNHRLAGRLEYNLDSSNSFIISPRINLQNLESTSGLDGFNNSSEKTISKTSSLSSTNSNAININNNFLYRRKFETIGRTFSVNIASDYSNKENNQKQVSNTIGTDTSKINQEALLKATNNNQTANITYTEPIGKKSQLMLSYSPAISFNKSEKSTNAFDTTKNDYSKLIASLSNNFESNIFTSRSAVNYNYKWNKLLFAIGATHQVISMQNSNISNPGINLNKRFDNLLPNAMFQYDFSNEHALRLYYRTGTNTPSINQLQQVTDNSNPLILSKGNQNLRQDFSHMLIARYGINNSKTGKSFYLFTMFNYTNDYIANSNTTFKKDTLLDGLKISAGSQLSSYQNANGNYSIRSMLNYSSPVKFIKSNLNLTGGITYTNVPGYINEAVNEARTTSANMGLVIGSNISPKVDFNFSYTGNVNWVRNTIQAQLNSNYITQNATGKLNLMPNTSWVFSIDLSYSKYAGLEQSFSQDFMLVNGGVGYKFLPKKLAEIRLSVFDLLNQNNNINRTVTETYIEDSRTKIMRQYFLVTFTYSLRKFNFTNK